MFNGALIAEGVLARLIRNVVTFGFHMATMDVREHARRHEEAVEALYARLGVDYAGMSAEEREATGDLLGTVVRDRTVVVIEHDMDFLRRFAHTVTVLHAGRVLSEGTVARVQADPRVQEVYLGRAAAAREATSAEVA